MEPNGTRLKLAMEEGAMWIAFFSIASAAAIVLSVAAVLVQAKREDFLRG